MGGEKDVLVIGDYNMIPGEDDDNFDTLWPHRATGQPRVKQRSLSRLV